MHGKMLLLVLMLLVQAKCADGCGRLGTGTAQLGCHPIVRKVV
jgi:hypothetical protein